MKVKIKNLNRIQIYTQILSKGVFILLLFFTILSCKKDLCKGKIDGTGVLAFFDVFTSPKTYYYINNKTQKIDSIKVNRFEEDCNCYQSVPGAPIKGCCFNQILMEIDSNSFFPYTKIFQNEMEQFTASNASKSLKLKITINQGYANVTFPEFKMIRDYIILNNNDTLKRVY